MKISCLHGYFKFEETVAGEISHFMSFYGLDLVRKDDYFTFESLSEAPAYSFLGHNYLGSPAIKNYQGDPWEIMRENSLIYDFDHDLVVSIFTITQHVEIVQSGRYYISNGLILPGSLTDDGERVTDYAAWFSFDTQQYRYTEVTLV